MTSNYAMERSGNGWRVRAASAPEIIALAARGTRVPRSAHRERWVAQAMCSMRKGALGILAIGLCSCAVSPANPLFGYGIHQDPKGDERVLRGVVNGLWRYDPEKFRPKMAKYDEHLTPEELSEYSSRYIVRVGVDRAPPIEFISPVVLGKWVEFVVLPAGWTHDLETISGDPNVINVGDIVEVRAQKGRYFDFLVSLVRQCSDPVTSGENKDWNIGCKTYKEFDNRDFAGDYHFLRSY